MERTRKLTYADFEKMLARQNNKCGICGKEPSGVKPLSIDHCHDSGFVRGLLCGPCNTGIGLLRDDPDLLKAAVVYLTDLPLMMRGVVYKQRPNKPKSKSPSQQKTANSKRKRHAGPKKKLEICSCCGELLGVRERRAHGERKVGKTLQAPSKRKRKSHQTTLFGY